MDESRELVRVPQEETNMATRAGIELHGQDSAAKLILSEEPAPVQEQELMLNMGPQHPSTHGVSRILLELDGEIVKKAIPDIGYLHRGIEKIGEYRQYNQFVPWTDRMDYIAAFTSNLAWVQTVEGLMGVEIPVRAKYLRVLFSELQRIASHLLWLGTHVMDLGAITVFLFAMR